MRRLVQWVVKVEEEGPGPGRRREEREREREGGREARSGWHSGTVSNQKERSIAGLVGLLLVMRKRWLVESTRGRDGANNPIAGRDQ